MIYLKMPDGKEYNLIFDKHHNQVLAWDKDFDNVYTLTYLFLPVTCK